MIEALSNAQATRTAAPPTLPDPVATSTRGDFDAAYADAAAPAMGGCQCDRPAPTGGAGSSIPSASAPPSTQVPAAAPVRPATSALPGLAIAETATPRPDVDRLALLQTAVDAASATAAGRVPDPSRTPTCGECGLPFALPDDASADPHPRSGQPTAAPLVDISWLPVTRQWLRPTD